MYLPSRLLSVGRSRGRELPDHLLSGRVRGQSVYFSLRSQPCWFLSRHRDESIMIGDDVMITIVDIRGDKVRLGIDAPQEIPVHRQEVYDAIKRENQKASRLGPSETRDVGK